MLRTYYALTKPGIIYGNLLTTAAGFFLASKGSIDLGLFVAIMAGTTFVIASGCVFNNYLDRGIDITMERTKQRALVEGTVTGPQALTFATILALLGGIVLIRYTNWLTFAIGMVGFVDYVVLYGVAKRRSVHGTIVGSIAGSAPIVAGYTAVTGRIDTAAIILFLILTFWQMPHFYAIAIYRLKDYRAAKLPVLPAVKGIQATKVQIVVYIVAFVALTLSLSVYGYTGYVYTIVMIIIGLIWLGKGIAGFSVRDDIKWARRVFFFSLITILSFSVLVSFGKWA